jgi:hypothetical protein
LLKPAMMQWMRGGAFTWDDVVPPSIFPASSRVRDAARFTAVIGFLVVLGYCASIAWDVLRHLANVKLSDCRHALDVVSVRDAVLCFLGYRLGLELLRSVTRRPR